MNKLAIVGVFFDGYYDLWEDFFELFEQNWSDCPYQVYIVNNERELEFNKKYNVRVLHAGKDAEYSRKVQTALEMIDADYYLLLLEDFFIGRSISNDEIEKILEIVKHEKLKYYCMPMPEFSSAYTGKSLKKYPFLHCIDEKEEYTVSCQPSIWEKDFLRECIGEDNYNAWIFEGVYLKSKKAHQHEFLKYCAVDKRNVLNLHHGALQGKMLPDAVEHFSGMGYSFKNNRETLGRKALKKHRFKQFLKSIIPTKVRNCVKKKYAFGSVIEKYSDEIAKVMKNMGIE